MAEYRGRRKRYVKKKVCYFCSSKNLDTDFDYKNTGRLKKYITEKGKIIPRRITGTCAKHQRKLASTIKRARVVVLLPFVNK